MNVFILYLLIVSIIISSSEPSIQSFYIRRIADVFTKMGSKSEALNCDSTADCSYIKICINEYCRDPCPGLCGVNSICNVVKHIPSCTCPKCYKGDAYKECTPFQGLKYITCQFGELINQLGGL